MKLRTTLDDLYAWQILGPLTVGYPYLPFTGATAHPVCLARLLNDIVVNRRRSIIELGAGISTVLIGRLFQKNRLDARLMAVDHDGGWISTLEDLLKAEKLSEHIELVHAPLVPCALEGADLPWYDVSRLKERIGTTRFDLAFVDGPPAFEPGKQLARYPALPFLLPHLADRFSIFLDDTVRAGEQEVLARWAKLSPVPFVKARGGFAIATKGASFFTDPLKAY
jgi:hypothetical protein